MKLPQFFSRPSHTLLYITEVKTFRIDTDRKGEIVGVLSVFDIDCDKAGRLPAALEQIISQSSPLGRKVWVFYVRLNTHALSLPSAQVEGIEGDMLEQALQFEYEAMTGRSIGKNRLAYCFLGSDEDMSHYWLNLIAEETLADTAAVLKKAGCALAGLSHPGGLPVLLSEDGKSSWWRIECWSTTVFALTKTPDRGMTLQIMIKEQHPQWHEELDQWLLETGPVDKTEVLLNNQIEFIPESDAKFHLTDEAALTQWLALWAKHLIKQDAAGVPLLNPKVPINRELFYMVGSGVSAALLCVGHSAWLLYQTQDYEYKTEALTQAEQDLKVYRESVYKNQQEIGKLEKKIKTLQGNVDLVPKALSAFKARPASLLKHLAVASPDDVLIESVEVVNGGLRVSGVALEADLPNRLSNRLEPVLSTLGWRVNAPSKKDMALLEGGGPWEFSVMIDDNGLSGFIENAEQTPI